LLMRVHEKRELSLLVRFEMTLEDNFYNGV